MSDKVSTVLTQNELRYIHASHSESKGQDNIHVSVDEFESGHGVIRLLVVDGHLALPLPEADTTEAALVMLKLQVLSKSTWFSGVTNDLISAHATGKLARTLIGREETNGSFFLYFPEAGNNGVHELLSLNLDGQLYDKPEIEHNPTSVKVALKRFIEQVPTGVKYGELAKNLVDHFVASGFVVTDIQVDNEAPVYHFHISFSVLVWGSYYAKVIMTIRV